MIYLSAGHSNSDPGAVANGYKEADIAVELRNLISEELKKLHVDHVCDSNLANNLDLKSTINKINLIKPKLAIELHCNASTNPSATGVECLSLTNNKKASQLISATIAKVLGLKLRGDSGWQDQSVSPHGTLGFCRVGGIIIELFFISNPKDLQSYQKNKNILAKEIALCLKNI